MDTTSAFVSPTGHEDKHPLEIKIISHAAEGGISKEEAANRDAIAVDSYVLIKSTYEDSKVGIGFSHLNGWETKPLSFDDQFLLFLGMAGHIAREDVGEDQDRLKKQRFCRILLGLHQLTEYLTPINHPQESDCAKQEEDPSASQPHPDQT